MLQLRVVGQYDRYRYRESDSDGCCTYAVERDGAFTTAAGSGSGWPAGGGSGNDVPKMENGGQ